MQLIVDKINTPIGEMVLVADPNGNLRAADCTDYEPRMLRLLQLHYRREGFSLQPEENPFGFSAAMTSYFAGDLAVLNALPVADIGTPFQRAVWQELRRIPCGTTLTYSELAVQIGKPAAVRAVGLANGANPIGVIVPCHRVIGANGSLTGYGGGMERKRWLLEHESVALPQTSGHLFPSA